MIKGHDILCISSQDWDVHFGTPQQTIYRLARHNRVLYVNLTYILPTILTHRAARKRIVSKPTHRDDVPGQLFEYSPPPVFLPTGSLPEPFCKAAQLFDNLVFASILKRQMALLNMTDPILWIYSVKWPALIDSIPSKLSVYDCVDEWGEWSGDTGSRKLKYGAELDQQLCENADLVFVVSKALHESKSKLTSQVHLVPNAVDFDLFHQASRVDKGLPDDFPQGGGPVVGYTGYLDDRLDIPVLIEMAKAQPGWRIVLVGPCISDQVETALTNASPPNIHWLGPKDQKDLPSYIRGFDVCLVPYRIDGFTRNIYPLKLYEYMASGKPIVSSPIPAVEDERPLVEIASTPAEFIDRIQTVLTNESAELTEARIRTARENTWDERAERKSSVLEQYLEAAS